jgi:hypothetical protein
VDDHRRLGSADAYDRFSQARLQPAIQKVTGMDPAASPGPTRTEFAVHNYIRP